MKRYTMATVPNPSIVKRPLKFIEIPLHKFSEEVVPHHQSILEQFKVTVTKLISVKDFEQLKRDIKDRKRTIKQLRDLMYELDTLRTQVENEDLDKFDNKTLSLRKIIINLINGYLELEKSVDIMIKSNEETEEAEKENFNPSEGTSQIQIQGSLEDLKQENRQEQLNKVENINKDIQDLHHMYKSLNELVETQGSNVEIVEKSVDTAQQNVESGAQSLVRAHKIKAVAYPVTGAFLGGMIGGPIGLVAGVKIGGLAAIGCAIAGYTGGRWFKKFKEPNIVEVQSEIKTEVEAVPDTSHKKDI